jgi:Cu-Zn family superoxide dismutase
VAAFSAILLVAIAQPADARKRRKEPPRRDIVKTVVRDATGAEHGIASLYQRGQEVRIELLYKGGFPSSIHGVHMHQIGKCEAPDFASAGPHWNPYKVMHGKLHPLGGHAGDLPNLELDKDGNGKIDARIDAIALTEGQPPLVNGGAIVVHANPDDMKTDPSGNSGARIACGVLSTQ